MNKDSNKVAIISGIIVLLTIVFSMLFSLLEFLNTLLLGVFGFSTYIILFSLIIFLVLKLFNKLPNWKFSFYFLNVVYSSLILLLLHYLFNVGMFDLSFSETMEYSFKNLTLCGSIGSIIMIPFALFTKTAGTIVIFCSAIIILLCICIDKIYYQSHLKEAVLIKKDRTKKYKNIGGSMSISNNALALNNNAQSFIEMPLTLNSKLDTMKKNDDLERQKSQSLYKQNSNFNITDNYKTNNKYDKSYPIENINSKPQIITTDTTKEENFLSQLDLDDEENRNFDIEKPYVLPKNKTIDDVIGEPQFNENNNSRSFNQNSKNDSNFNNNHKDELDKQIRKNNLKKNRYIKPPLDLLTTMSSVPNLSEEKFEEKARVIEQKLEEFRINAKCIGVTRGPAITRYEFEMPQGISVNKILQYSNDLSMVLESRKSIRIEAPIPGKNAFGVEVPNTKVDTIGLRDLVSSPEFVNDKKPLTFALGKDLTNRNIYGDVAGLVHTLVAGSTGSGKSVCLNAILISLLYKSSPSDVRIILIDPKLVEFNIYEKLPHLLVPDIVTEPAQAVNALNWAIEEMERRNRCFGQYYVRSIDEFNNIDEVKNGEEKKMPYIIIMADELADLMLNNKKEIEDRILKLSQKARSAGIHLILATQRPSVDIITGTIKANLPSRIAFSLTNYVDSKTIIDQGGAEKLLGRGDMLYLPRNSGEPERLLGPFISQKEVRNIVEFVKANNEADFDEDIIKSIFVQKSTSDMFSFDASNDEYFVQAVRVAVETGQASTSYLQRKFGIGFQRAGKIIDQMEAMGYISASLGSNKGRKVLITEEEFLKRYGEN